MEYNQWDISTKESEFSISAHGDTILGKGSISLSDVMYFRDSIIDNATKSESCWVLSCITPANSFLSCLPFSKDSTIIVYLEQTDSQFTGYIYTSGKDKFYLMCGRNRHSTGWTTAFYNWLIINSKSKTCYRMYSLLEDPRLFLIPPNSSTAVFYALDLSKSRLYSIKSHLKRDYEFHKYFLSPCGIVQDTTFALSSK